MPVSSVRTIQPDPAKLRKRAPRPVRQHANSNRASSPPDLRIVFPEPGRIQFFSRTLFSDAKSALAVRFFERVFLVPEVDQVEIDDRLQRAELRYRQTDRPADLLIRDISRLIGG